MLEHMFQGAFEHNLDNKGRLMLPVSQRAALATGVFVTRGIDHCLWVYPRARWEQIAEKIHGVSRMKKNTRSFVRFFYGAAAELELDKQGRVLIPAYLREYADLEDEVVVVGAEDHLEVWNAAAFRQADAEVAQDPEALAESLSELELL